MCGCRVVSLFTHKKPHAFTENQAKRMKKTAAHGGCGEVKNLNLKDICGDVKNLNLKDICVSKISVCVSTSCISIIIFGAFALKDIIKRAKT